MNTAPAEQDEAIVTRAAPTVNLRLALVMVVVVLLIDQVIAFYAGRLATYSSGWFAPFLNRVDPDHAFSWLCLHHVALLVLTLPVLLAWRSIPLRRRGLNLDQWQTSLRWFGWFVLYCTLGVLLLGVLPHLLRKTAPQFDFPLNPRNVGGCLGFYYLLSGTGEEPLFRGLVMGTLLIWWRREFRVGRLVMPAAGLWATLIFMVAHVNYTLAPFRITNFNLIQQFFCAGFGVFYALALYRTRSLLCPILAHGFSNGIIYTFMYALALWAAPPPADLPANFVTGSSGDGQLSVALEKVRAMNHLPALAAVSVAADGRIIDIAAVGVRCVGKPQPVTTNDQWHLGSITKPISATLAARLVEQGRIGWQTKVTDLFPSLASTLRPEYREVTLTDLLSHNSGLPMGLARALMDRLSEIEALSSAPEQRRHGAALILLSEPVGPRGKFSYSNTGFILAAMMMEEATNTRWETLMRREVFEPLGMTGAGIGPPGTPGQVDQPWGHVASPSLLSMWQPVGPAKESDIAAFWTPCGRLHVALQDVAKFAAAHLAGERGQAGLLSVESFRKLHAPIGGSPGALDWGVVEQPWGWGPVLTHDGRTPPWYAGIALAPQRGVAVFAASNTGEPSGAQGVHQAVEVLQRRLKAAEPPRVVVQPDPLPAEGKTLTITYHAAPGPLAGSQRVSLHHGHDGWKDTVDAEMTRLNADEWQLTLDVPPAEREIDFCFTDGSKWDNHYAGDWHVRRR